MNAVHNLPESSSPGKSESTRNKFLKEAPCRREIESAAQVPFFSEPSRKKIEKFTTMIMRTGQAWYGQSCFTVVHSHGTHSMLKIKPNRPLMQETLGKLDECEGRMSELLIDSATIESETNSPIMMTHQESNEEWRICSERGKEQGDQTWQLERSTK